MLDRDIVALYWKRSQEAIAETQKKYGNYCLSIARNILPFLEDAQECVNDTYLAAWDAMPPHKPKILSTFLGKLTRRISIDRWRSLSAQKRGGDTVTLALEELGECIASDSDPHKKVEDKELAETISRFLLDQPKLERKAFVRRYYDLATLEAICKELNLTPGKLRAMLARTRVKLRDYLVEEGY
jgi:RNA polymerase sigma-70 factor (ECF subfamily)